MPTFEQQLAAFAEKTKQKARLTYANSILGVAASILHKSPVAGRGTWVPPPGYDPGKFKANWNGSLGSPDLSVTDETDPTGEISMSRINAALPKTFGGEVFYISNSLDYAIPLEEGHSNQAPFGMVALTVLEWDGIVTKACLDAQDATVEFTL